ncbi:MAG: alpha-2-macroglobulin [Armatimonadota bacterium]
MAARAGVGSRAGAILLGMVTAVAIGFGLYACVLAEPAVGTFDGVLRARDSGRPIRRVEVTISGPAVLSARSDSEGRFQFAGAPVGLYRVSATSPGHTLVRAWVSVAEGKNPTQYFELSRRPSWVQLVLHFPVLYPGEPVGLAVSGLTLDPAYQLDVYRVQNWRHVREYEAVEHPKALAKAVELGEVEAVSSERKRPSQLDEEGMFYDRPRVGALPSGRYLLVATGETGSRSAAVLMISRLALLVKSDRKSAVAYVTDLKSGEPVAGARVSTAGSSGVTDDSGLTRLVLRGQYGAIRYTAATATDSVSLDSYRSEWGREPYRLYGFTDRPIYRPGDRVLFKGVLRRVTGTATYELPGRVEVKITVTDPDGAEIHRTAVTTNDQGSFAGAFDLPKLGRTGLYTLMTQIGGFADTMYVSVASYLKPEVQLTARPERPQYIRGQRAAVDIEASYYFGAPAGGLELRWTLTRDLYYPRADSEFEYDEGGYGGELVAEGEGRTDDAGRLRLVLPSRMPKGPEAEAESPYWDHQFTLFVYSTSEAGGSAEATTHYLVTRGSFYLTASPDRYVLTPGTPAKVKIEARSFEGDPVPGQQVELSLLTEKRPGSRGRVERRTLKRWTVRTGGDGSAETTVTAPAAGEFVLEADAKDAEGRAIAVRNYLWAASGEEWMFGEGQGEITIISDRKQYREGDHVTLLVTAQREGAGLLCLEGDRLYDVRPVRLRRGANLIGFDLSPEHVPNAFAWVGQVYGKELHQAEKEIPVSREARRLTVYVTPGQQDYRPGETASCRVEVKDARGKPAQAEVAIGVVDEAIYALAADTLEDPADFFYQHRWNQVNTAFAPTPGYMGGGDKAPTEIEVRRKFVDTAFWAPQVMTDAEGRATVSFKLPDNLTSWRVTCRAVSADTRGGQTRANFEVNKPLMVRLDLPRFATEGDRFRVSAYVHNETDEELTVALGAWARGLKLEAGQERLNVGARKVVRRDWWATAASAQRATIGASAASGRLNDALELVLPVNPFTKTQFDSWAGQTEDRASVIASIRDDSALDRTVLTIAVAPSVASSLFSSLDYLVHYPYGCVEQTVSTFLPDLYVLQLLEDRGLGDSVLAKGIPPMVREGLARLSGLRREEGGWGWGRWGDLDIWMTSYALLALQEARAAGYQTINPHEAVPMLEEALRARELERLGLDESWRYYTYPDDLAFAAYLLARYKSELALPTLTEALNEKKLSGRGRALCALALFELGNEVEAQKLVAEIWRTAKREGKWLYWTGIQYEDCRWWDGGANVEATAWSLKAALRADRKDPRAAAIAGWLLQQRHGDRWVSTRDTAIALMALIEYLRGVHEPNANCTAVVSVNGKEVLRQGFTSDPKSWREVSVAVPPSLLRTGPNSIEIARGAGAGRLYYRAELRQQVRIREGEATAHGDVFQVKREYSKLARGKSGGELAYGPASRATDTFSAAERVLVRLTINSKQRLRYALVEDPLPAGLEPSARGDVGFMDWRSWWVDNDVRDDKVTFYLDWLPAGESTIEYVVSARTPGQFSALPPSGFAMYQPEVNALGDVSRVEVKE